MREGTRTVLSMQNNYKGPPEAFAMVVPVPVVLQEGDVKTLAQGRVRARRADGRAAPGRVLGAGPVRAATTTTEDGRRAGAMAAGDGDAARGQRRRDLGVTIEAQFTVGEYEIVILSAKDSSGLDTWLRAEHYNIPDGAEPLLRPYVEAGSKFFVAKVDPTEGDVRGRPRGAVAAALPLRQRRLRAAGPARARELERHAGSDRPHPRADQRYEVANYPNVTIPTNLDVDADGARTSSAAFYAALFDARVEKHPGAVVTEYAWAGDDAAIRARARRSTTSDFATLGADVLAGRRGEPARTRTRTSC